MTAPRRGIRPFLEALETRLVPYNLTGYSWPHPELVTLSLVPDGTYIMQSSYGTQYSNLYARMSNFYQGSGLTWQNTILKAAQMWAQQTNINFSFVSDNGAPFESGSYQQGDPGMGDIRFSAINLGTGSSGTVTYAQAFYPPSYTGDSAEGDIQLNNQYRYGNNTVGVLDLWTLAVHEIGHGLGLAHTYVSSMAVMYPSYYMRTKLTADDIAGIQAIYGGPRKTDSYESAGQGVSFATAVDVSSQINATSLTAIVTGLDNTTSTDAGFYSFTAPLLSASTATVTVQSSGLSLLAPVLTVYAADQTTVLGTATATNETGSTLSVSLSNVTPGTKYYVKVSGNASVGGTYATGAFATGAYALTLNLGTGPAPTVPLPNTQVLNGTAVITSNSIPEVGKTQPDTFPGNDPETAQAAAPTSPNRPIAPSTVLPAGPAAPSTSGAAVSLALPAGPAEARALAGPNAVASATVASPGAVAFAAGNPTATPWYVASGHVARTDDADSGADVVIPSAPADDVPTAPSVQPGSVAPDEALLPVNLRLTDAIFAGTGEAFGTAPVLTPSTPDTADETTGARDHVLLAAVMGLAWANLPCRTTRRGDRRTADLGAAETEE